MLEPIPQRLAQTRVRFHLTLGKLRLHPLFQFLHYRPALLSMVGQALTCAQTRGFFLVLVDFADRIQHHLALGRVAVLQLIDCPSRVY